LTFLLRFQTPRARANRFYEAFFCQPFQAPEVSLPSPSDPCSDEPNLRERCGCMMCHYQLEPAAAYWARFADAGALHLNESIFPAFSQKCADCANNPAVPCDFICERFYVTHIGHPKEEPWIGTLKALQWRDEDELARASGGPGQLVAEAVEDGRLPICVMSQLFERFVGRPMSSEEKKTLEPHLLQVFGAAGYDFKALVKAIVTTDAYRRLAR
jgi:hypothetical protein